MIEPMMYFGLGFLAASLLALVIVPLVHSRSARLTRRRLEASMPLSIEEARAGPRLLIRMRGGKNAPDTGAGQDFASGSNPIAIAGKTHIHDDEIEFIGESHSNRILSRMYDVDDVVTFIG